LAFLFAGFIFLAHYKIVGSGVWGDGRYYYSFVRSLVIDRDLSFENELKYFGEPTILTKTGMVANKYSLGPALLWLPFFVIAHIIVKGDGYSYFYQIFTGLGSVFYGVLGLYLSLLLAKEYFSEKIALLATLGIWLGSNLFFYTAVDPINSHAVSFLIASVIIFAWQKFNQEKKVYQLAILGFLIGFLAMIRTQDIIFAAPLLILSLKDLKKNARMILIRTLVFLLFILIGFLPQLIVWKTLYGEFKSPYLIFGGKFNWLTPQFLTVLFSSNNGLFYYSPILLFSLGGFFNLFKKSCSLATSGIFLFLLQTYIVSSWHIWWGGASYGGRMFTSLMPFFIIALGAFINWLGKKQIIFYPILIVLMILNFRMIIKFLLAT
jgi:hypothetical protein